MTFATHKAILNLLESHCFDYHYNDDIVYIHIQYVGRDGTSWVEYEPIRSIKECYDRMGY